MKKNVLWSVISVVLIFVVVFALAKGGAFHHKPSQIHFTLNGKEINLEDAIDDKAFDKDYSVEEAYGEFYTGHTLDEIYVNVNNEVKTFATAMNDGSLRNTGAGKSPTDYTSRNIIFGEIASNVLISGDKDLQAMINDGYFYTGCDEHLDKSTWEEINECEYSYTCGKSTCKADGNQAMAYSCDFRETIETSKGICG